MVPVCGSCGSLEINCHYDHGKPDWMDNGERQQDMARRVKADIKRSANRRRSRRLIQRIVQDISNVEPSTLSQLGQVAPSSITASVPFHTSPLVSFAGRKTSANNPTADSVTQERPCTSLSNASIATPNERTSLSDAPDNGTELGGVVIRNGHDTQSLSSPLLENELQLSLVMAYLDYVFPLLFPFYRPSILEGGRSWLLVLLMKNKGLCHTAISLVSYFLSVVPVIPGPAHQMCSSKTWEELQKQTDLAIKTVQFDLESVNNRGVHNDLHDSAYLMESIVQLLGFEVIMNLTENWQMHLDAALVLFKQIFQYHGMAKSPPNISALLSQMGHKAYVATPPIPTPWNADQAAFRFFTALLLVEDIISSTSLECPPRLREYYPYLLANDLNPDQEAPLQLEHFIGCQSWAMLLVGEIATLDAWKKDMKKGDKLSMSQLVQRAGMIERGLNEGLARLDVSDSQQPGPKPSLGIGVLTAYKLHNNEPRVPDGCISLTRIWAHAARTYLLVVVSGWQPANAEVRSSVARTIELLKALYSPEWLRTLAWPFCVTGCLANEEQQVVFREIVSSMGALQTFGTMREALNIMEYIWYHQVQIDAGTWDIAASLKCLGRRVLLI